MEFSDTYIQRNSSKLKVFLFFYFPLTSCKKGNGWSFMAHIYKEIVQKENWFFFVTLMLLVVRNGVDGVFGHIYPKK